MIAYVVNVFFYNLLYDTLLLKYIWIIYNSSKFLDFHVTILGDFLYLNLFYSIFGDDFRYFFKFDTLYEITVYS